MTTPLASLPALHGHGFALPKKVNDDSHTLVSASWDKKAFGLKVKVSCNICKYLENFTLRQNSDDGKWRPDGKFQRNRNHSKDCNLLLKQKHLPVCKLLCGKNPTPVDYSEVTNRVRSFKAASWSNNPAGKNKNINKLAENGLFYRGEDDHVMCTSCHTSLKNGQKQDYKSLHAEQSTQPCTFLETNREPDTWEAARHFLESCQPDEFTRCIKQENHSDIKHIELTKLAKQAIESGKIQFLDAILANPELTFDTITVGDQNTGIVIFAITCMQAAALKILLESENVVKESEANRYMATDDGERWPRLCLAIERNRVDMVRLLMEHGDDPAASSLYTNPPEAPHGTITAAKKDIPSQKKKTLTHWTSWEYSLYAGKTNAFEMLINHGLAIHTLTDAGEQPIHIAAKTNNVRAIKLLKKQGANINAQTQSIEKNSASADLPGTSASCEERNATPLATEPETATGHTPLHYAARFQSQICYEWLIKHGADQTLASSTGKTAINYLHKHDKSVSSYRTFAPDEKPPGYFQQKYTQALAARQNKTFTR